MHRIDGAAGIGGDGRKERGRSDAKAHLLALHIATLLGRARRGIDIEGGESGIP